MRGALVLAATVALVAAGCGWDPGDADSSVARSPSPTISPTSPPPANATADDLGRASCRERRGGDAGNFPDFVEVRVEQAGNAETVEFRFAPEGDHTEPPQHFIAFADRLVTEGEGAPADVAGEAFLQVSFMARGVDLSGEEFEDVYTGPTEFTPGLSRVLEVEQLGDFEGLVSWGIGLTSRTCFVLDARPDRIVLSFPLS